MQRPADRERRGNRDDRVTAGEIDHEREPDDERADRVENQRAGVARSCWENRAIASNPTRKLMNTDTA